MRIFPYYRKKSFDEKFQNGYIFSKINLALYNYLAQPTVNKPSYR
jgi:hypothetical protein